MVSNKQERFLEKEIRQRIRALSSEHYNHEMNKAYNENYEDRSGEHEAWEFLALRRIYFLIVAYLETKGQVALLDIFRRQYDEKLHDADFMMKEESRPYEDSDVGSLARLQEFEDFLTPFEAFSYSSTGNESTAIEQLESILGETHHILTHNNVQPENETKVYKEMKWLLQFIYPGVRQNSGARIIEKFQAYKPDILIPEIEVLIEYKFIKEASNPARYIDELLIDSSVYHKDPEYSQYFAVMYFERNKYYTKESVKRAWVERSFPSNWRLVLPGL